MELKKSGTLCVIRLISQGKERNKKGKPGLFIPVTEAWNGLAILLYRL
jgi:hypothetical protein